MESLSGILRRALQPDSKLWVIDWNLSNRLFEIQVYDLETKSTIHISLLNTKEILNEGKPLFLVIYAWGLV